MTSKNVTHERTEPPKPLYCSHDAECSVGGAFESGRILQKLYWPFSGVSQEDYEALMTKTLTNGIIQNKLEIHITNTILSRTNSKLDNQFETTQST